MSLSRADKPNTADVSKKLDSFSAAVSATPKTEPKTDKSVLISLRISEKKRDELKSFFAAHGMTLSAGLIAAATFLEVEEQMGSINLSDGVVIKRR